MRSFGENMLNKEMIEEIQGEFANYPTKQAACIEALKLVQRENGWVSDADLQDLAGVLEMTPDELDSVATFYNLIFRRPVGKHVILICDSVSCWLMGEINLYREISKRLGIEFGQTTEDGRFTVLPMACLGACDHAPVLMIDNDTFRDVEPGKLDEILARFQ
jgi:NADH-quinone oxidoreductase subunit E